MADDWGRLSGRPPRVRVVLSSLAAAVLLGWFAVMAYAAGDLALRGTVAPARVVSANYGAGTNFVQVLLPAPASQIVGLDAWSGTPAVGSTIDVRYDPNDPGRAEDARVTGPWLRMSLALVLGIWFAVAAWWAATRSRSVIVS
jgi:hypothetical protein